MSKLFEVIAMKRKFYCFNSTEDIEKHLSQIKSFNDLMQLRFDIMQSATNQCKFNEGYSDVYAIDDLTTNYVTHRHLFFTKDAADRHKDDIEFIKSQAKSITILEN